MREINLELVKMGSLPALHKYLRRELALPVYYGANLDALYDCLTALAEDTQLVVPKAVGDDANLGWYGKQFLQVLQDAAAANAHLQVIVK